MGISVNAIVLILIYAFGINYILLAMSYMNLGINCPSVDQNYNSTTNSTNYAQLYANAVSMALGRCDGLPFYIWLIFELPVIAGLLYVARAYIGAT